MAEKKKAAEALNVEDALTQSEAFLIKYRKTIIAAVVAVVVIITAVVLYRNYYSIPREEKAQAALFRGQEYFEADNFELALNGDSIEYLGFVQVAKDYSGTKAGELAKAYSGLCYANLGQWEEAIKALDSFSANDRLVGPALKAAAGNCYAHVGKLDKAASLLLKAADEADSEALSPIYLIQAGQLLLEQGKTEQAIQAYTKAKDKYPGSYATGDIDKYIEQARIKK